MYRTPEPYKPLFGMMCALISCSVLIALMPAEPAAATGTTDAAPLIMPGEISGEYKVASAGFSVARVRLYFEDKRPEITIKRNQPSPAVYAELEFTGSGLLEGSWEADGRLLAKVSLHVVSGKNVIIQTPESPGIPTYDPGTHRVRFAITNPGGVKPVEALYFVTAEEFRTVPIKLHGPEDKATIDYASTTFTWEAAPAAESSRIEFLEKAEENPFFSATTIIPGKYALPAAVLGRKFQPGRRYYWKVKGIGHAGEVIGESPLRSFSFSAEIK